MENSWLIQRLCKPTRSINPFAFGGGYKNGGLTDEAAQLLAPIFSFDYMGAAEYEFGDVARTFGVIIDGVVNDYYERITVEVAGHTLHVFCNKHHVAEMEARLKELYDGKHKTRDLLMLHGALNDEDSNYIGWLELNNKWIAFRESEPMDKLMALFYEGEEADEAVQED